MAVCNIALIQMKVSERKQENLNKALAYLQKAKAAGADMALLPEMFCCPYETNRFLEYAEPEDGPVWTAMAKAARKNHIYVVAGSMPEREGENIYNTSYVFDRAGLPIAKHRKVHLFDIQVEDGQHFQESETLTAGNRITVFDTEFGKMGLLICYDLRFPELSRQMVLQGALVLLAPAAFNHTTGPAHWELLFRARAVDNQVFTVGVAPAFDDKSSYQSYGNSIAVSPWGEIRARMDAAEGMVLAKLDMDEVARVRRELPLLLQRRPELYFCT